MTIVQGAINREEPVRMDTTYMMFDLYSNVGGVIKYLEAYPEKHTDEFLGFTFKKYWRSIVNIAI